MREPIFRVVISTQSRSVSLFSLGRGPPICSQASLASFITEGRAEFCSMETCLENRLLSEVHIGGEDP